jgi:hypothetical protein
MGLLIVKSDFIGKYALATSTKGNDNIDDYIAKYEEKTLRELLGIELFDLFKADVNGTTKKPVTQIYLDFYNEFTFKDECFVYNSFGLKNILLSIIYYYYVRDNVVKQSLNGDVNIQSEVSSQSNQSYLYLRYNEGIDSYNDIQSYCIKNKTDVYPTFDGVIKRVASLI